MADKIPENLTQLEYAIRVLEAFKKGGLHDTGARVPLDGFNLAIRMIRTLSTVVSVNDFGDRLIIAFDEYADSHGKSLRSIIVPILRCTECGQNHGDTKVVAVKKDGPSQFWYICPVLLQAAYYFPDD